MSNIILVRHTQTVGNVSEKIGYTGYSDTLTPYGIQQAKLLGKKLTAILDESTYDKYHIYLSEANRTRQTAIHSGLLHSGSSFSIDSRLNEIHMGNLLDEQVGGRNRGIFQRVLSSFEIPFFEGESVGDVQRRVVPFLQTRNTKALHICFTSGVVVKSILHKHAPHMGGHPKNGSITRLSVDDEGNIGFISYEDLELLK